MFLATINTASYNSDSPSIQILTVIDADPNNEDEELIAEAIKLSITPMNTNSNEYITNGID